MVSTRRGVRVCSPIKTKTTSDESVDVQATPSTARRTVSATTPLDTSASEDESRNVPPESTEESIPSLQNRPALKRCTRSSRLHSPSQPCTPAGSVHEADVSDMESCCSALSDHEPPPDGTQRRGRRAQPPRTASQEEEAGSEAESCPSPLSPNRRRSRRTARARKTPERPCTSHSDATEAEAGSQRATRSARRSTRARAPARTPGVGGELSDADSCASGAAPAEGPASSARTTRSARRTALGRPIPLHLDTASEGSRSPAPRGGRRPRAARGDPASEPASCDSDGMESGPSTPSGRSAPPRRSNRSRGSAPGSDSSDVLETSSRRAIRLSVAQVGAEEQGEGPQVPVEGTEARSTGDQSPLDQSTLERTLVEDADCTLVEEKTMAIDEEEEEDRQGATNADLGSICDAPERAEASCDMHEGSAAEVEGAGVPSEAENIVADSEAEGIAGEDLMSSALLLAGVQPTLLAVRRQAPAVSTEDQQRETSQESQCDELPPTQEVPPPTQEAQTQEVPPPTQEEPPLTQEVPPPTQEAQTQEVPPLTQEVPPLTQEVPPPTQEAQTQEVPPPTQEVLPSVQAEPSEPIEVEVMEVDASDPDAPQTEDSDQVMVPEPESIQVNSCQEPKVKVELASEPAAPQHTDVVVHQKTRVISLLDSSEEEEEEEGDEEESDCELVEEDGGVEQERAGSSKVPDGAEAGGLFMIDTRPGQDADQQYVKEGGLDPRQEEDGDDEDEDFVDEEGDDDDDDDEDALLFTRNRNAKELSTSIDPGLRVKELGGLYINFDGSKSKPVSKSLKKPTERNIQDEVMKNSVIGPEFEKQSAAPPYKEAKRRLKMKRRDERQKTTGDGWFDMKAPELTPELKADLKLIKMRGSLDPKRFYKKSDREGLPKYFQVGTVMDSPVDFYHARVPKKDRKRTMVEELMADSDFRKKNKKKYMEIMAEKTAAAQGRSKKKKLKQSRQKPAF